MKPIRKLAMLTAAAALTTFGFGVMANAYFVHPFDGNLVLYYSFDDDATATTATDESANSNDGVISGAVHDCADTPSTTGNSCNLAVNFSLGSSIILSRGLTVRLVATSRAL